MEEVESDFLAVCCSEKSNPMCVLCGWEGSSTKFCLPNYLFSKHLEKAVYHGVRTISLYYKGLENIQNQLGSVLIP